MKRVTVDMGDGLYQELRRIAYIEHKPMAEIIRTILSQALTKGEKS